MTRIGRPPGKEYPHLVHLKISDEQREFLESLGGNLSAAIRECVEEKMEREEESTEKGTRRSHPRPRVLSQ